MYKKSIRFFGSGKSNDGSPTRGRKTLTFDENYVEARDRGCENVFITKRLSSTFGPNKKKRKKVRCILNS